MTAFQYRSPNREWEVEIATNGDRLIVTTTNVATTTTTICDHEQAVPVVATATRLSPVLEWDATGYFFKLSYDIAGKGLTNLQEIIWRNVRYSNDLFGNST